MIAYLRGLPGYEYKDLSAQLGTLYHPCCEGHALPSAEIPADLEDLLREIVDYIYETRGLGVQIDAGMILYYAGKYWKAVQEGYGRALTELAPETADHRMLEAIQGNVWQFSGAKTYSQLRTLSNALVGEDGRLLTLPAFRKVARTINGDYVGPWLDTEYHTAIGGAQMAAKWVGWKEDGVQLLEFDAVMDNRTTQTCRELNGTVKPITDPFWRYYYPPNHFLCRSTARALYTGAITPDSSIQYPDIPDMFKTNLSEQGLVFPKGHPYFKDLPAQVSQEAEKLRKDAGPGK